jgi:hypothetical protein
MQAEVPEEPYIGKGLPVEELQQELLQHRKPYSLQELIILEPIILVVGELKGVLR